MSHYRHFPHLRGLGGRDGVRRYTRGSGHKGTVQQSLGPVPTTWYPPSYVLVYKPLKYKYIYPGDSRGLEAITLKMLGVCSLCLLSDDLQGVVHPCPFHTAIDAA